MNRNINKLKKIYQSCGISCTKDTNGQIIDDLCNLAEKGELGSGGGSADLVEYNLSATEIVNAKNNGTPILPPDNADGFSKINADSLSLTTLTVTSNGTKVCGSASNPYFWNKVVVDVPTENAVEEKTFSKSSDPFTLDCSGKTFVYFMTDSSSPQGIAKLVNDMTQDLSINITSSGSTAGTMTLTVSTKTITYTPNTSFQMGSVKFKLVVI